VARIVVGVDGSPPSLGALRWALDEAALRGAAVDAVHVWHYPIGSYVPGMVPAPAFVGEDLERDARAVLDHAVDSVLPDHPGAAALGRRVVEGAAVEELVRAAEGADLLVVGSRGHGGFTGLLLGSVAQQVAQHAPCPVVIVRRPGR
jgi:nucleotide-binding universal stress UspA family protein